MNYIHTNAPKIEEVRQLAEDFVDPRPGHYYASAVVNERGNYYLLAGPFADHKKALEIVDRARVVTEEHKPEAFWWNFGTLRIDDSVTEPPKGRLNAVLGLA